VNRTPKITVVTPSYNQAAYLEQTIRSVLDQGYPDLEYIVIDGGSSDGSVEIIKKYEKRLAYWHSRRDGGQSDAIRQGLERATGEIMAWLNSDDYYETGTLKLIAEEFGKDKRADVVYGNMKIVDGNGLQISERRLIGHIPWLSRIGMIYGGYGIYQPASFWRSEIYRRVGGLDPKYVHCMDNDLFAKFAVGGGRFRFVRSDLASFRVHAASKTVNLHDTAGMELAEITEKYALKVPLLRSLGSLFSVASLRMIKPLAYIAQGDGPWLAERLAGKFLHKDRVP